MSNTQATVARRGNINPIPSNTPIFDELDAHFYSTPTESWDGGTVIDVQIVAVRDTGFDEFESASDTAGPELLEPALWVLALGAAIGTILWLYITLTPPVIA